MTNPHRSAVWALAFAGDARLMTGGADGSIALWGAADLSLAHSCRAEGPAVRAIVADGDRAFTGDVSGGVSEWDVRVGRRLRTLDAGPGGGVYALACTPSHLFAGRYDGHCSVWERTSGDRVARLSVHDAAIQGLAVAPRGRVWSGSRDGRVRSFALDGDVRTHGESRSWVSALSIARDGQTALSVDEAGWVRVWDVETGQERARLRTDDMALWGGALSPDGALGVVGGAPDRAVVWDLAKRRARGVPLPHVAAPRAIAFAPDGRRFATACDDSHVRSWDAATGDLVARADGGARQPTFALAWLRDLDLAVVGAADGGMPVFDTARGMAVDPFPGHEALVYAIASAGGGRLVSGGFDGRVFVWDVGTRARLATVECGAAAFTVDVAEEAGRLLTNGPDGTLGAHALDRGERCVVFEGHPGERHVYAAFTGDERRVVSGGEDGTLRVWDAATGRRLAEARPGPHGISCLATLDATRVVVGWSHGEVGVFDADRGAQTQRWPAHEDWVREVRVSSDRRFIASVCQDFSVSVFDLESVTTRVLRGQRPARSIAFGLAGELLSAGAEADRVDVARYAE